MLIEPKLEAIRPSRAEKMALTKPTIINARAYHKNQWSALTEAFFTITDQPAIEPGDLVITELNYNPAGSDNTEFIELANIASHGINLRSVSFSSGVDYSFPSNRDVLVGPGQRIVLAKSLFDFQNQYGLDVPVTGLFFGNLANDQETIELVDSNGQTLLSFSYDDQSPWPILADGGGSTLVLTKLNADLNDPASWTDSVDPNGTPGW